MTQVDLLLAPLLDVLDRDAERVVMTPDGRVMALSPLPTRILRMLDDGPVPAGDVKRDLAREFGVPPGGLDDAFQRVLETLVTEGLVQQVEGSTHGLK